MRVVISIPAYNEEKTLGRVIRDIRRVMNSTKYRYQVLVVDDGSKDRTVEVASKEGALIFSHRHLGLAETFKREMQECLKTGADVIVHTDADGQYPPEYIPAMIKKIEGGADMVMGSRFGGGAYRGSMMKKLGNMAFAKVLSGLLGQILTDTTTGFRAFTKEVAQIRLINNFTYTQEQIIKAAKQGFKIKEIPIKTKKTRASRLFSNPFEYAFKAWLNILRIYRDYDPIKFFGTLGMFFVLLGFGLGIWILITLLRTGGVGGIPRVILCALFLMTGIQIMAFGFLADMNRK